MARRARQGTLGMTIPLVPGVTPGSGPAHLSLFGYDPIALPVGRGVLEAVGVGLEVGPGEGAARGNFCPLDGQGRITDRRARRPPTEQAAPIVQRLSAIRLQGASVEVRHVREHRFALVL